MTQSEELGPQELGPEGLGPEELLRQIGVHLQREVLRFVGPWITRSVLEVFDAAVLPSNAPSRDEVEAEAEVAGEQATDFVRVELGELLSKAIDQQRTTPLSILRASSRFATAVLAANGVPPVVRDGFKAERYPEDLYDLAPTSFTSIGPELSDIAIAWGASKAMAHKLRHGSAQPDP